MTNLDSLSADQLRKVASIKDEIERLQAQLASIAGNGAVRKGVRRVLSPAAKARIAAAQRKRWAKVRAAKGAGPKKQKRRRMSPAVKARLAAIARARWAKVKAAGKKTL